MGRNLPSPHRHYQAILPREREWDKKRVREGGREEGEREEDKERKGKGGGEKEREKERKGLIEERKEKH